MRKLNKNSKNKNSKSSKPTSNRLVRINNRSGRISDYFIPEYISLKFKETTLVGTATNASPLYILMNWPSLGTGYSARTGNSIGIPYIDVNYSISPDGNGYQNCRLIVMQQTGSLVAVNIASYFLPTAAGVVPESVFNPGMNQENKILYDATHNLNTQGNRAIVTHRVRVKPSFSKIVFNGDTLTVWKGNIFAFIICGPGSVGVDLNAQFLMHFTD